MIKIWIFDLTLILEYLSLPLSLPSYFTQNAYLCIEKTTKHGDELVCSFDACRYSGIKFLYCSYCDGPVYKRDFAKRHCHLDDIVISKPGGIESEKKAKPKAKKYYTVSRNNATNYATLSSLSSSQNKTDKRTLRNQEHQCGTLSSLSSRVSSSENGDSGDIRDQYVTTTGTKRPQDDSSNSSTTFSTRAVKLPHLESPKSPKFKEE